MVSSGLGSTACSCDVLKSDQKFVYLDGSDDKMERLPVERTLCECLLWNVAGMDQDFVVGDEEGGTVGEWGCVRVSLCVCWCVCVCVSPWVFLNWYNMYFGIKVTCLIQGHIDP